MASRLFTRNASSFIRRNADSAYGTRKFFVPNLGYSSSYGPNPRFTSGSPEEIRFEIPAPGLEMDEIKMHVRSRDNRFILVGESDEKAVFYKQHLDLPKHANFEKAEFEARLAKGMVYVTVTNFQKDEVVLTFD